MLLTATTQQRYALPAAHIGGAGFSRLVCLRRSNAASCGFFVRSVQLFNYAGLDGKPREWLACPKTGLLTRPVSRHCLAAMAEFMTHFLRNTAMNALTTLTISDISIRQDEYGRYCLNDLHKASGNDPKNKPANWQRIQQAIDLIQLLESEQLKPGIPAIQSKQQLGTFAVKDLVYAYAMWISAEFTLKVIHAYDALVTGQLLGNPLQLPEPPTLTKAQQGELFAMVANKARSSGKPNAYFWSRYQNHFKLASYKDTPADQFEAAKDYLRRLEGEDTDQFITLTPLELSDIIQQNLPKQTTQDPLITDPAYRSEARKAFIEHLDTCHADLKQAGVNSPAWPEIDPKTVDGVVASMMWQTRWLLTFNPDTMKPTLTTVPDGALVMTEDHWVRYMREHGYIVVKQAELLKKLAV